MQLLCFTLICLSGIIGFQYGRFSANIKVKEDDLSDCCGATVVEKKITSCLSCGHDCKTKKRNN